MSRQEELQVSESAKKLLKENNVYNESSVAEAESIYDDSSLPFEFVGNDRNEQKSEIQVAQSWIGESNAAKATCCTRVRIRASAIGRSCGEAREKTLTNTFGLPTSLVLPSSAASTARLTSVLPSRSSLSSSSSLLSPAAMPYSGTCVEHGRVWIGYSAANLADGCCDSADKGATENTKTTCFVDPPLAHSHFPSHEYNSDNATCSELSDCISNEMNAHRNTTSQNNHFDNYRLDEDNVCQQFANNESCHDPVFAYDVKNLLQYSSSDTEDPLLSATIRQRKGNFCASTVFLEDGKCASNDSQLQKRNLVAKWKDMDAEVIKCRLEKSEKQWKKMKRDNIAKQIKDAKEYKKMFGNWVRKEWTVDEEEIEMWEEAEAKMKAKEEKVLQEIVKGEVEQLTVEEMKNLLKEADEKRIFQEEKENLQTMIDKKEKNCEKKRQRREISAEKYLQMLREPLVEHCEKQKRMCDEPNFHESEFEVSSKFLTVQSDDFDISERPLPAQASGKHSIVRSNEIIPSFQKEIILHRDDFHQCSQENLKHLFDYETCVVSTSPISTRQGLPTTRFPENYVTSSTPFLCHFPSQSFSQLASRNIHKSLIDQKSGIELHSLTAQSQYNNLSKIYHSLPVIPSFISSNQKKHYDEFQPFVSEQRILNAEDCSDNLVNILTESQSKTVTQFMKRRYRIDLKEFLTPFHDELWNSKKCNFKLQLLLETIDNVKHSRCVVVSFYSQFCFPMKKRNVSEWNRLKRITKIRSELCNERCFSSLIASTYSLSNQLCGDFG